MESVISAKNLDVGYDKKAVISGISIDALKGQIICLLGPNGSGKSTILRTLSGLLAPVNGIVEISGENIGKAKPKDIAKKLSLVLTDSVAPALTTVNELVAMGRTPYTGFMGQLSDEDWKIVDEALETVGATNLRERLFTQLSDGEKQKVMIARALVQEPELIILDEPTSHLDIKHKVEVIGVLQRLANEKHITCILSLHDIDLALKGCRTVMLINNGEVVAQGTPEEVVKSGTIQSLYDISGAKYNELLGSVELIGNSSNDIFVTGGNGSGISIYRALSRNGYGLTSGVLHKNDADFQVADTICSEAVTEAPFEAVTKDSADKAFELIKSAKCVVDSGFPIGSGNVGNAELLRRAVKLDKPVFSLRSKEECEKLYESDCKKIILCDGIGELLCLVERLMKGAEF